jgi:hypothetical protein
MTRHINPGTDTTINPLRCKTCGHYKEGKYADTCKNTPFPDHMDSAERQYIKDWIKEHGCASHTSAPLQTERLCDDCNIIEIENKLADTEQQLIMAQQRVDAAIKELERLAAEKDQLKKESKTNEPWMGHAYAASAYMKAIALLQAGDQHE